MLLAGIRNYKQLSLLSLLANIAIILAVVCVCGDCIYNIAILQSTATKET
jgi:hypothetical protein